MPPLKIRLLGQQDYTTIWHAMQSFTEQRSDETVDEIWCLEHPAVFTLGRAGRRKHIHHTGEIPLIHVDRGGQVTYHGPGQVVIYLLLDLRRRRWGIRHLVNLIEKAIIALLADYQIDATIKTGAPGVYVNGEKIAALGMRVRKGCTFHGLSLNVAMVLEPFTRIDPCGYPGLSVTQTSDLSMLSSPVQAQQELLIHLTHLLEYDTIETFQALPNSGDTQNNCSLDEA